MNSHKNFSRCLATINCEMIPIEPDKLLSISQMVENDEIVSLKILFYQCCDKAVEVPCSGDFPNDDEFTSCKCQGDYFLLRVSETCNLISEHGNIIKKRILYTEFAIIFNVALIPSSKVMSGLSSSTLSTAGCMTLLL